MFRMNLSRGSQPGVSAPLNGGCQTQIQKGVRLVCGK